MHYQLFPIILLYSFLLKTTTDLRSNCLMCVVMPNEMLLQKNKRRILLFSIFNILHVEILLYSEMYTYQTARRIYIFWYKMTSVANNSVYCCLHGQNCKLLCTLLIKWVDINITSITLMPCEVRKAHGIFCSGNTNVVYWMCINA